jgi:putative secretion ATPase (PEP-CTERM system associated)
MYTEFFGLKGPPFQLTPDHRFFFASSGHARANGHLVYGLHQGEGFIVITGDIGAGKTTLVSHLLSTLDKTRYVAANVVTTQLGPTAVLRTVASAFGLDIGRGDKTTLLWRLESFFAENHAKGRRCVLLVDEGQNLSVPALEELRMLSNFQFDGQALLQSFLLGQPQFRRTLANRELGQLRQRIIASYHLGPMNAGETREYIRYRLGAVGWDNDPAIDEDAFAEIHHYTGGVPRRINILCTRLLLFGFLEERHTVDAATVRLVAEELVTEIAQVVDDGDPAGKPAIRRAPPADPAPAPGSVPESAPESAEILRRVEALETKVRQQNRIFIRTLKTVAGYLEVLSRRHPAAEAAADVREVGPVGEARETDRRCLADRRRAEPDRRQASGQQRPWAVVERRSDRDRRVNGDRRLQGPGRPRLAQRAS